MFCWKILNSFVLTLRFLNLSRSQRPLLSLFDLQPPTSQGEASPTGFRTGPVKQGVEIGLKNTRKAFPEEGAQQTSEEGPTARKEVPYAPQV